MGDSVKRGVQKCPILRNVINGRSPGNVDLIEA